MLSVAWLALPQGGEPLESLAAAVKASSLSSLAAALEPVVASPRSAQALPWLFEALSSQRFVTVRSNITGAIVRIGPRAALELPDAGRWLAWPGWRETHWPAGAEQELIALLDHPQQEVRLFAADELVRTNVEFAKRLDGWLQAADHDTLLRAVMAAGSFANDRARFFTWQSSTELLARQLDSDDAQIRYWAAWSLGRLSLSEALEAAQHDDPRVRRVALQALERSLDARRLAFPLPELDVGGSWTTYELEDLKDAFLYLSQDERLDVLCRCLDDSSVENRILALMALAKLQRATPQGVRRIRAATRDPDASVRLWASHVLERVQPPRWPKLRLLTDTGLQDETATEARALEELAAELTAGGRPYAAELPDGDILHHLPDRPDSRFAAAVEIAGSHLPDLLRRADEPAAQAILDAAEHAVEHHVRVLILVASEEFLDDEAKERLVQLGPAAIPQVTAAWLVSSWRFRGGTETSVRDALGPVLARLGPRALPALSMGLEHQQGFVANNALDLALLASDAEAAFPALLSAWRFSLPSSMVLWSWENDWETVRSWPAAFAGRDSVQIVCSRIGSAALPWLIGALSDEHAIVRAKACRGLAAIEVESDERLAALEARLDDDEPRVRYAAAEAILTLPSAREEVRTRSAALLAELGDRP
jgi:hypothetical protein